MLLSLIVLAAEGRPAAGAGSAGPAPLAQRVSAPQQLGKARIPALAGLVALTGLSLGVPVGYCLYWIAAGGQDSLTGVSMPSAALTTALYGLLSAGLATLMALPVALLAVRHHGRARRFLERSTYLVLAVPGVVIALALSYFTERYLGGFGYRPRRC